MGDPQKFGERRRDGFFQRSLKYPMRDKVSQVQRAKPAFDNTNYKELSGKQ